MSDEGKSAVERAREALGLTEDKSESTENSGTVESSGAADVRQFEIEDHLGDKHKVDLDMSNEEILRDIVGKAKKADILKEDLEAMEAELAAIRKRDSESQELIKKLNKFAGLKGRELAEAVLMEEGGLGKIKEEWQREYEEELKLTPEEKAERERKRKDEAFLKQIKDLQDQLKNKDVEDKKKMETVAEQALMDSIKSGYGNFKLKGDNSVLVKALNREMVDEVKEGLREKKSRGVQLTQSVINREFRRASEKYGRAYKTEQSKLASDVVNKQIDDVTSAAQVDKGGKGSGGVETQADTFARWRKLISEGNLRDITREVNSDPKKAELFLKFR